MCSNDDLVLVVQVLIAFHDPTPGPSLIASVSVDEPLTSVVHNLWLGAWQPKISAGLRRGCSQANRN